MAQICRIGHDHQATFQVIVVFILAVVLVFGIASGDTRQKKLPHGQYTSDPIFLKTDSGPPIKLLVGGLIRSAPTPLSPL